MIAIYFKTTQITIKFLEQCILPRIILVPKSVAVVNINFVRHPTSSHSKIVKSRNFKIGDTHEFLIFVVFTIQS